MTVRKEKHKGEKEKRKKEIYYPRAHDRTSLTTKLRAVDVFIWVMKVFSRYSPVSL
jgi:hypothetical protein